MSLVLYCIFSLCGLKKKFTIETLIAISKGFNQSDNITRINMKHEMREISMKRNRFSFKENLCKNTKRTCMTEKQLEIICSKQMPLCKLKMFLKNMTPFTPIKTKTCTVNFV